MSSLPKRAVVEHGVRLDILDCLDGLALTSSLLSARLSREERHVAYHLSLLKSFGLAVKAADDGEDGAPFYVARLKDHPVWVARAVNVHRRARANQGGLPS